MGQKIKKLKKIRLHREGTDQLVTGAIALVAIAAILWTTLDNKIPFWAFVVVFGTVYDKSVDTHQQVLLAII